MTALLVVLGSMLAVAGVVLIVAWWGRPTTQAVHTPSTSLWTRLVDARRSLTRPALVKGILTAGSALALTWYTGWPLLLAIVPIAVIGLPKLLGEPPQPDIELLQALDRWVRGLTATMGTGRSITDSIRASVRHAPPLLAEPVALLVRRLDDRWTAPQALQAMADELASPDADAVLAALMLSAHRGGAGASATLGALADSLQERLKALRDIETERAKPRLVVRQVTGITVVVLGAALLFGRGFFEPYSTPLGQVILAALVTVYVLSLVLLRRMTLPRRRARILRGAA